MSRTLLITFLLTLINPTVAQTDERSFPGVKNLMSSAEFTSSGLDRLSDEELDVLDDWLVRYTAGHAAILRVKNPEVIAASKNFELLSQIKGDFRGWSGETLFQLENGQVWRQRLQGRYTYTGPPNPEIRITRSWMGFYKLTIIDTGSGIGVSQVR